jgi:hypothetical protein
VGYWVVAVGSLLSGNVIASTLWWLPNGITSCPTYNSISTAISTHACYDNALNRGSTNGYHFVPNGTRWVSGGGNCNSDEIPSRTVFNSGWCLKMCPGMKYYDSGANFATTSVYYNPCGSDVPIWDYPSQKITCVKGY